MAYPGTLTGGLNNKGVHVFTQALSPALIVLNTAVEQSLVVAAIPTVNGALPIGVTVNKPTAQAGLGIVGARVIDSTHIGITFGNFTGGSITPTAAEVYTFTCYYG